MRLLTAHRKLHLYAPMDLGYLLACKLMLGRPEKDGADMAILRQALAIQNRVQAQQIVDRYFPSPAQQAMYRMPCTLELVFEKSPKARASVLSEDACSVMLCAG